MRKESRRATQKGTAKLWRRRWAGAHGPRSVPPRPRPSAPAHLAPVLRCLFCTPHLARLGAFSAIAGAGRASGNAAPGLLPHRGVPMAPVAAPLEQLRSQAVASFSGPLCPGWEHRGSPQREGAAAGSRAEWPVQPCPSFLMPAGGMPHSSAWRSTRILAGPSPALPKDLEHSTSSRWSPRSCHTLRHPAVHTPSTQSSLSLVRLKSTSSPREGSSGLPLGHLP